MQSDLVIRTLAAADVADYRTIRLATLRTEPRSFGSLYEDEVARSLLSFGQTLSADDVLGAYVGSTIVGTARLHSHEGVKERHKGSLHGVFVAPEHRGRGVASALLEAALNIASAKYERIILSVVADNTAAISLYQRFGFVTFGVEPCARCYQGVYTDVASMGLELAGRS